MIQVKYPIALVSVYLWIGFVCAISFMEAWLKFRASGVTVSIGLNIGRLVFNALNKVEWVFAIAIFADLIISKNIFLSMQILFKKETIFYLIPLILLIIQTFWTLPALDKRAEMYIENLPMPASYLHFYYVAMEALKVGCLFIFVIKLFN